MIFKFDHHVIDIDVERTRTFYKNAKPVTSNCSCSGCRNYERAVHLINKDVISMFSETGISMEKACEVYGICEDGDDAIYYGGFYHLCGNIVSGGYRFNQIDETTYELDESSVIRVDENFAFGFSDEIDLLEEKFPEPVIQLEFHATIPWVLDEKLDF